MDTVALSTPVEGGVQDTSVTPVAKTERPELVANDMSDVALRAHEADLDRSAAATLNRLTGKGSIIDQMI
ncbi:hypothetical protein [Maridesulfovibrio frigidus]|uniref:hypothetical protein n=1 Tax=Maridesulfovibrio frigidus TaxID=340956 RepID=UPI0004E277BF|nr:hypothetical protein [Maridesulfovibrio frigidus]